MKKYLWLIFSGTLVTFLSVSWISGFFAIVMTMEELVSVAQILSYADAGIKAAGYALIIWGLVGLRKEGEGFASAAAMAAVCCVLLAVNVIAAQNPNLMGGQFSLLVSLASTTALLLFQWLLFGAQIKLAAARRLEKLRGRLNLARWAAGVMYAAGVAVFMVSARMSALVGNIDPATMDVNELTNRMMANSGDMLMLSAISLGLGLLSLVATIYILFALLSSARELGKPLPQVQA